MFKRLLLFILTLAVSACATLDYENYGQPVLVTSDPPGVDVYQGEKLLGTTPAYMRVRRGRQPRLRFVPKTGAAREVKLETDYRWRDSFAMNLLWWTLAPAGWFVDWATGTAWKLQDPPVQTFGVGGKWPRAREPRVVAIAPPRAEELDISDGLGTAIDTRLRGMARFKVLEYETTAPTFQYYQSSANPPGSREKRYRLFDELKVDHVLYSETKREGDTFYVTSHLNDVVTGRTNQVYNFEISPREALKSEFELRRWYSTFFHLLPNTVFFNFSTYSPELEVNQVDYVGKEAQSNDSVDRYLRYFSAISISTLERPIANVRGQWKFDFVPAIVLSKKTVEFPNYAPIAGVHFERLYASAGYGFETGYLWRHGLVYMDLIPTITWSQVSYTALAREGTSSRYSIQSVFELGYNKFLSEHLVGKLFLRNVGEDSYLWSRALTEASGQPTYASNVGSVFVGLAIGYYLPSTLKSKKGWSVRESKSNR